MNFRQIIDNLIGRTSSTSVSILERTHFDGEVFKKVIDIDEDLSNKRKNAKEMDLILPDSAPHKILDGGYRLYFELKLSSISKEKNNLKQLIRDTHDDERYSALLYSFYSKKIYDVTDDGYRAEFKGYLLSNKVEIVVESIFEGEVHSIHSNECNNLFPVSYRTAYDLTEVDSSAKPMRTYLHSENIIISPYKVNSPIQLIFKGELRLFLQECLKIMSPV